MFQAWQRMLEVADVHANGLDDNDVNGYQLLEALQKFVSIQINAGKVMKEVALGEWDMTDSGAWLLEVPHGLSLTEYKSVIGYNATLQAYTETSPGVWTPNDSITGFRDGGGTFNAVTDAYIQLYSGPSFSGATDLGATGGNRGFLQFWYTPD